MKILNFRRLAVLATTAVLTACSADESGSTRLKELKPGMTLEEALAKMGPGPTTAVGADSARVLNGYRRISYLIDGKQYLVLYSREEAGDVKEPVVQERETPVVFKDGKLLGSGWRFYVDEAMGKEHLPTPLLAVDTVATKPKAPLPIGPAITPDSTRKPTTPPAGTKM